jgi:hypothetical protein
MDTVNGTITLEPPLSFVPMPSDEYRTHRKLAQATKEPGAPQAHPPGPIPQPQPGSRVLMWKQDPAVAEIGVRKAYLPGIIVTGPRDARIVNGTPGIAPVSPNVFGDLIFTAGTDQFDAVHTFAVVRQTLTLFQRALTTGPKLAQVPWQWNSAANVAPLSVFPHGLPNTMNAFYSRNQKALKFGDFVPTGSTVRTFTCRSFDIVAHETAHAILDGLKPGWLAFNNPPQTGGLHESMGDLAAIFLALSQYDQVEAIIAQTKGNLHDKTFLADLAEQFGLALGRPNGLRNADNDLTLSQTGTEVHAISQVFTGAVYDILADLFAFGRNRVLRDDAAVLHETAEYLFGLLLRAIVAAPASGATYADVANKMLTIAAADGKPAQYRTFIRNRFSVREVIVSPMPLAEAADEDDVLVEVGVTDEPGAAQDRSACCGTMNNPEFLGAEDALEDELEALREALASPAGGKKRAAKK